MLTLRDFLSARAVIARGQRPKEEVLASLRRHDALPQAPSWLKAEVDNQRLDRELARVVYDEVERYEILRAEHFYAQAARPQVGSGRIDEAIKEQSQEVNARRLSDILVSKGWLTPDAHAVIVEKAKETFRVDTESRLNGFYETLHANSPAPRPAPPQDADEDSLSRTINISNRLSGELLPSQLQGIPAEVGDSFSLSRREALSATQRAFSSDLDGQATISLTPDVIAAMEAEDDDEDDEVDGGATMNLPPGQLAHMRAAAPAPLTSSAATGGGMPTMDIPPGEVARARREAAEEFALPASFQTNDAPAGGGFKLSAAELMATDDATIDRRLSGEHANPAQTLNAELLGDPMLAAAIGERYELRELLGQGQMGKVFLAWSKGLEREVALKLAQPGARNAEEVIARFKREILVTTIVSHPNVVEVYDKDELPDGSYFMAMELLKGQGLDAVLRARGKFPIPEALDIFEQLTRALEACHEAEVVHRDVKPENVTVIDGAPRVIKLVDFGLARLLTQEEVVQEQIFTSLATQVSGSPHYMAPESITDASDVDTRCDLYALGVTLFELLTGAVPFDAKTPNAILEHQLYSSVPLLEDRLEGVKVPRALEGLIRKLMEKDRDLRYQSCAEVLTAITEVRAALEAGEASPPAKTGLISSITNLFRRNKSS